MARRDHGNKLKELVLQPGARFRETRAGLDVGQCVWMIDQDSVAKKKPMVGISFLKGYPGMFLEEIEITLLENNLASITGNFLGLLNVTRSKPDLWDEFTDSEYAANLPAGSVQPITFQRPSPQVTHTYIRKERPTSEEVGTNKVPKGYPDRYLQGDKYWWHFTEGQQVIFEGWILKSRAVRIAGRAQAGSIYEVVDVYSYEYLTVEQTNWTFDE